MREKEILRRIAPLLERVYAIDKMRVNGTTPSENIQLSTDKQEALKLLPSFSPLEILAKAEPVRQKVVQNPYDGGRNELYVLECANDAFFAFERMYDGMRTYYHDGTQNYVVTEWFPQMNGNHNGKRRYSRKRRR